MTVLDGLGAGLLGWFAPAQQEGGSVTVVGGREPEQVSGAPVLHALVELAQEVWPALTDPLDDLGVPHSPAGHGRVDYVQDGVGR